MFVFLFTFNRLKTAGAVKWHRQHLSESHRRYSQFRPEGDRNWTGMLTTDLERVSDRNLLLILLLPTYPASAVLGEPWRKWEYLLKNLAELVQKIGKYLPRKLPLLHQKYGRENSFTSFPKDSHQM